jgi:ABC-type polysaccharide/polyol phosphate export permease
MGLLILRYCLVGLAILLCLMIGIFHRVPQVEGLMTVLILVFIGIFFQNEKQLNILNDVLKELQKK